MASVEHEPITGVYGQSPPSGNSGGRALPPWRAKPTVAECFYILCVRRKSHICPLLIFGKASGKKFAVHKMNTAKTAFSHRGSEVRGPAQVWGAGPGPTSPIPRAGCEWVTKSDWLTLASLVSSDSVATVACITESCTGRSAPLTVCWTLYITHTALAWERSDRINWSHFISSHLIPSK